METIGLIGALVCALSMAVSENPVGVVSEKKADIRGKITAVNRETGNERLLGTVMIESGAEQDAALDKARVRVTKQTHIFVIRDGKRLPATFDDLQIGAEVEAQFAGPVMESYPVQAAAKAITVLDPGAGR